MSRPKSFYLIEELRAGSRINSQNADLPSIKTFRRARKFVAFYEEPVRHGMTVGELARMWNIERKVSAPSDGRTHGQLATRSVV
jgi:Protein of unknown function (DUF1343)